MFQTRYEMNSVSNKMRTMKLYGALGAALAVLLTACGGQRAEPASTPHPPPSTQKEASEAPESSGVRPAKPEGSFKTGEIVGEALSNALTDLKSFAEGVWSELSDSEDDK